MDKKKFYGEIQNWNIYLNNLEKETLSIGIQKDNDIQFLLNFNEFIKAAYQKKTNKTWILWKYENKDIIVECLEITQDNGLFFKKIKDPVLKNNIKQNILDNKKGAQTKSWILSLCDDEKILSRQAYKNTQKKEWIKNNFIKSLHNLPIQLEEMEHNPSYVAPPCWMVQNAIRNIEQGKDLQWKNTPNTKTHLFLSNVISTAILHGKKIIVVSQNKEDREKILKTLNLSLHNGQYHKTLENNLVQNPTLISMEKIKHNIEFLQKNPQNFLYTDPKNHSKETILPKGEIITAEDVQKIDEWINQWKKYNKNKDQKTFEDFTAEEWNKETHENFTKLVQSYYTQESIFEKNKEILIKTWKLGKRFQEQDIIRFAMHLITTPTEDTQWYCGAMFQDIYDEFKIVQQKKHEISQLTSEIKNTWKDNILDIDVEGIKNTLQSKEFFIKFLEKARIQKISERYTKNTTEDKISLLSDLSIIDRIQSDNKKIHAFRYKKILGDLWDNNLTQEKKIMECLEWATKLFGLWSDIVKYKYYNGPDTWNVKRISKQCEEIIEAYRNINIIAKSLKKILNIPLLGDLPKQGVLNLWSENYKTLIEKSHTNKLENQAKKLKITKALTMNEEDIEKAWTSESYETRLRNMTYIESEDIKDIQKEAYELFCYNKNQVFKKINTENLKFVDHIQAYQEKDHYDIIIYIAHDDQQTLFQAMPILNIATQTLFVENFRPDLNPFVKKGKKALLKDILHHHPIEKTQSQWVYNKTAIEHAYPYELPTPDLNKNFLRIIHQSIGSCQDNQENWSEAFSSVQMIERFKKINQDICIYAPTQQQADLVKNIAEQRKTDIIVYGPYDELKEHNHYIFLWTLTETSYNEKLKSLFLWVSRYAKKRIDLVNSMNEKKEIDTIFEKIIHNKNETINNTVSTPAFQNLMEKIQDIGYNPLGSVSQGAQKISAILQGKNNTNIAILEDHIYCSWPNIWDFYIIKPQILKAYGWTVSIASLCEICMRPTPLAKDICENIS